MVTSWNSVSSQGAPWEKKKTSTGGAGGVPLHLAGVRCLLWPWDQNHTDKGMAKRKSYESSVNLGVPPWRLLFSINLSDFEISSLGILAFGGTFSSSWPNVDPVLSNSGLFRPILLGGPDLFSPVSTAELDLVSPIFTLRLHGRDTYVDLSGVRDSGPEEQDPCLKWGFWSSFLALLPKTIWERGERERERERESGKMNAGKCMVCWGQLQSARVSCTLG